MGVVNIELLQFFKKIPCPLKFYLVFPNLSLISPKKLPSIIIHTGNSMNELNLDGKSRESVNGALTLLVILSNTICIEAILS